MDWAKDFVAKCHTLSPFSRLTLRRSRDRFATTKVRYAPTLSRVIIPIFRNLHRREQNERQTHSSPAVLNHHRSEDSCTSSWISQKLTLFVLDDNYLKKNLDFSRMQSRCPINSRPRIGISLLRASLKEDRKSLRCRSEAAQPRTSLFDSRLSVLQSRDHPFIPSPLSFASTTILDTCSRRGSMAGGERLWMTQVMGNVGQQVMLPHPRWTSLQWGFIYETRCRPAKDVSTDVRMGSRCAINAPIMNDLVRMLFQGARSQWEISTRYRVAKKSFS